MDIFFTINFLFLFFNEFDNIFEIIGRNLLVFGKERNHFFVRFSK